MKIQNHIKDGVKAQTIHAMALYCVGYLGLSKSKKTLVLMLSANQVKETDSKGITATKDNSIIVCLDSRLTGETLLTTLAHEMVHVKQLATGLLKYDNADAFIWRGKPMAEMSYLSRPWELQAMAQSEILMRKFIHAFNEMIGD